MNSISYWEKSTFYSKYDVIILGAGIVGLNAAIHIKQQNKSLKVCVLERGILPSGASTKNAGFTTFGSLSELIEQLKRSNEKGMLEITERRYLGLKKLINTVGKKTMDYQQWGGHELFKTDQEALFTECKEQLNYFNGLLKKVFGLNNIFSIEDKLIKDFGFSGLNHIIKNSQEGQIDTGKMMEKLMSIANSLDVKVFTGVPIKGIFKDENGIHAQTETGEVFSGKQLLVCTNAFAKNLFPKLDIIPGRGQVVITKELRDLKFKGTFHYDKGYYYFRNINNRVLFGGGRNIDFKKEETYEFGNTEEVMSSLRNILREVILPKQAFEIDYSWSGIMAFGKALEPIVEKMEDNIYCAVRCNGMGVALGSLIGMEVADLFLDSLN